MFFGLVVEVVSGRGSVLFDFNKGKNKSFGRNHTVLGARTQRLISCQVFVEWKLLLERTCKGQ